MDFSYVHIRYFIGYVYHICLQDTIQSTLSLSLRCQAMLLPMPLRPLLLTTRSGFNVWAPRWADNSCSNNRHTHPNFKQDVEESLEMKIRKLIGMFQCNPENSFYILLSIAVHSFWQGGLRPPCTQPLSTTSLGLDVVRNMTLTM